MPDKFIALSDCLIKNRPNPIAYHAGRYYHSDAFYAAVSYWINQLKNQPFQRYALYTEDAYPFAVLLFALFHAGKEVWIASNNHTGTAQQLARNQCQLIGDWTEHKPFDYQLNITDHGALSCLQKVGRYKSLKPARSLRSRRFIYMGLSPLNSYDTRLVIFTSGSTGQAKPIQKRLIQFELECAVLEKQWGKQLGDAEVLATVSHQHIYGLLFRVLWSLSAGRCFHSQIAMNPELLVKAMGNQPACWIASPAQLKRLDAQSPWQDISTLTAIFSSGGALPETAKQLIVTNSKQQVIEVYGSSETGGIAWRQHDTAWQLFDGMALHCIDENWQLSSPYINEVFTLDDSLSLQANGRFILHGRKDRIVKIEEKRLSLTELEQRLIDTPWIADAFVLPITKNRDIIGAAVVLTESGLEQLNKGRNVFIKQIRTQLYQWFDAIVLPRKWLILNTIPLTAQGKINQPLIKALLDINSQKLPIVQSASVTADSVELMLKVPEELIYFPDHFAQYPILAGVVQIAWVEHFGKLFFTITQEFTILEALKFVKVIQPNDALKLTLNWNAATNKLHFNFGSNEGTRSSGRLVYATQP
jgi:acyl-coenzyme A synthetase/AMP-(fatty) acid ligase/3-hydroxymyristoyl/3-hydroxydecanoyl-(acyl carrier protein) dehydratase